MFALKLCTRRDVQLNPSARGTNRDFLPPNNDQESEDSPANKQWDKLSNYPPPDSLELEKHDWLLVQPEQNVLPKKKINK